ncbi:hypothetical protein PRIPAC_70956 [Pristionchus pacificus]|uniref:Uncharacterized protein n=1 Tax=Pristionchus pacificus TaxID=54126 RepID=A0A2A6C0K6_PRIPA|nr:hypothetical protein PRIPAC_70956 [Pristionchus pacificus]|eukprot:PDM71649.1 hypothetical protein PRIPAC_38056 [Pristionchus pacificus]
MEAKPSDDKEKGCKDCHLYAKALKDVQKQLNVTEARLEELSIAYSQLVRHCNQVNAAVNGFLSSNNGEGYSTDTNMEDQPFDDPSPLLDNYELYSHSYPQWPYVFPKPTAIDLNDRVCTYGCKEGTRYTSRIELAQHMEKNHLKTLQRLSLAFFKLIGDEYGYVDPHAQTADYAEMYNILSKVRPYVDE